MSNNQTMNDEWDQLMSDLLKYAENLQTEDPEPIQEPKKYTKISDLLKVKADPETKIADPPKEIPKIAHKKTETSQSKTKTKQKIMKKNPTSPPKLTRQRGFYKSH